MVSSLIFLKEPIQYYYEGGFYEASLILVDRERDVIRSSDSDNFVRTSFAKMGSTARDFEKFRKIDFTIYINTNNIVSIQQIEL